jgi:hypothetical protein
VGLFRRRETLVERLAREGGLDPRGDVEAMPLMPEPAHRLPDWMRTAYEGPQRPRQWDAVLTVEAPQVRGDEVEFVALPDGSLLVEEEEGEAALDPLANALEARLRPPYRARGVRKNGEVWAVSAISIRVAEFSAPGQSLMFTRHAEEEELVVDGARSDAGVPGELEALAEGDCAVAAERLDGDLWEVKVSRL